jgi:membrane protein YqaA with SNARE-associated domain
MNELTQIFVENFLSRLVISLYPSVLLEAKYYFGQNVQSDLAVAFMAILCAFGTNYYLGRLFALLEKYFDDNTKNLFTKAKSLLEGQGRVLLMFAFLPFGGIILLSAGILRVSLRKIFPFIIIGAACAVSQFIYF